MNETQHGRNADSLRAENLRGWKWALWWVLVAGGIGVSSGWVVGMLTHTFEKGLAWGAFFFGATLDVSALAGLRRLVTFVYACVLPSLIFFILYVLESKTSQHSGDAGGGFILGMFLLGGVMVACPLGGWIGGALMAQFIVWVRR